MPSDQIVERLRTQFPKMAYYYRQVDLTPEILEQAEERASQLPIYERSHRGLPANIVGCIGEVVFQKFLVRNQIPFEDLTNRTDLDYIISGEISVDVKTKDRTVLPQRHFANSVPLYNHDHQRPDYYYFVSLLRDRRNLSDDASRFKKAFLMGGIDIGTLEHDGERKEAGETDPNGTTFWTPCINVSMEQLISNAEMLKIFKATAGNHSCHHRKLVR